MKTTFPLNTRLFITFLFAVSFSVSAQVGIGTTTPKATLDIAGQPTETTQLDGVIPPRITGDQLRAKTYTSAQTAAIVYATAADSAPTGQTLNVTQAGYYYFNGTLWIRMAPESDDWKISGNSNTNASINFVGTTNDVDLKFKRNGVQSGWLSTNTTSFGVNTIDPTTNTGAHNTAIGHTVLQSNTTGHRNTAIGSGALTDNTTGFQNVALGRYTMHFNISGSNNMAIGQEAAKWNSTGINNVAIGFNALRQNGTGSDNVAIGRSSMATLHSSGDDIINNVGDNNITIGAFTELPVNTASNQMVLGNPSIARTIINGIANTTRPAGRNASGVQGEIRVADHSGTRYLYICYATNSWGRVVLQTTGW